MSTTMTLLIGSVVIFAFLTRGAFHDWDKDHLLLYWSTMLLSSLIAIVSLMSVLWNLHWSVGDSDLSWITAVLTFFVAGIGGFIWCFVAYVVFSEEMSYKRSSYSVDASRH